MSAPTWIPVTQEHINQGAPKSEENCPIALALRETWDGPVTGISVLTEGATVYTSDGWYSADSWPQEAGEFIDAFDFEQDVEPFGFEVSWDFHPEGPGL